MSPNKSADEERSVDWDSVFSGRHDRRKVTDWAYEELRGAIMDFRLPPGEPLREAPISERLGVSKTPVREALTRLEQEGLVETTSFKGAIVSGYSSRDLEEIYEIRELLQGAAARQAALLISEEDLETLEELVEGSRKQAERGNRSKLAALLTQFDSMIFDQVTNQRMRGLIENLQAHLTRIGKLTEDIPGRVEASVEEHARVVQAIRGKDAEAAERHMREHVRSVMGDQLEALEKVDARAAAPLGT